MDIKKLATQFNRQRAKYSKEVNSFFADVVLGEGNWEWRMLNSGREVIVHPEAVFAIDEWSVLNRQTAIEALQKLQQETGLLFEKEIQAIDQANPVTLRAAIPAALLSAKNKSEEFLVAA